MDDIREVSDAQLVTMIARYNEVRWPRRTAVTAGRSSGSLDGC